MRPICSSRSFASSTQSKTNAAEQRTMGVRPMPFENTKDRGGESRERRIKRKTGGLRRTEERLLIALVAQESGNHTTPWRAPPRSHEGRCSSKCGRAESSQRLITFWSALLYSFTSAEGVAWPSTAGTMAGITSNAMSVRAQPRTRPVSGSLSVTTT